MVGNRWFRSGVLVAVVVAVSTGCWAGSFHLDTDHHGADSAVGGSPCGAFIPAADGYGHLTAINATDPQVEIAGTIAELSPDGSDWQTVSLVPLLWAGASLGPQFVRPVRAGHAYKVLVSRAPRSGDGPFDVDISVGAVVFDDQGGSIATTCVAT
jgi:hypothetical protein